MGHPNHYYIVLSNTVDLATMELIQQSSNITSCGHQIDVNNVTILDKEENWFERGVWVRTRSPSLYCNGGTRIKLSRSWDHYTAFFHFRKVMKIRNQPENSANTSCHHNNSPEED